MLESIKHKSKKSFYPQKIIACKDNAKNTWNVRKELVGKTWKSEPHLLGKLLINEQELPLKEKVANKCNIFLQTLSQS